MDWGDICIISLLVVYLLVVIISLFGMIYKDIKENKVKKEKLKELSKELEGLKEEQELLDLKQNGAKIVYHSNSFDKIIYVHYDSIKEKIVNTEYASRILKETKHYIVISMYMSLFETPTLFILDKSNNEFYQLYDLKQKIEHYKKMLEMLDEIEKENEENNKENNQEKGE